MPSNRDYDTRAEGRKKVLARWTRTKRCTHVHFSGRRCAIRIKPDTLFCGLHKAEKCVECNQMLESFKPPNGWSAKVTGDIK